MKTKHAVVAGSIFALVSVFGCSSENLPPSTQNNEISAMKAELEKMQQQIQAEKEAEKNKVEKQPSDESDEVAALKAEMENMRKQFQVEQEKATETDRSDEVLAMKKEMEDMRQKMKSEQERIRKEQKALAKERIVVEASPEPQNTRTKPTARNEFARKAGDEFTVEVPTRGGGKRTVGIDADTMVAVELQDGRTVLAPTVAFISNFDILNEMALANLSGNQRKLIEQAGQNMSMDRSQVAFMLEHIKTAHGVPYEDVKAAAKACEKYFPELTK